MVGLWLSRYGAEAIADAASPIGVGRSLREARPYWIDVSLDGWIALFAVALCLGVTVACGLIPALQISRTSTHETLKEGGRIGGGCRARRWIAGLMVAQLALTLVLLTSAGLLWRRF